MNNYSSWLSVYVLSMVAMLWVSSFLINKGYDFHNVYVFCIGGVGTYLFVSFLDFLKERKEEEKNDYQK